MKRVFCFSGWCIDQKTVGGQVKYQSEQQYDQRKAITKTEMEQSAHAQYKYVCGPRFELGTYLLNFTPRAPQSTCGAVVEAQALWATCFIVRVVSITQRFAPRTAPSNRPALGFTDERDQQLRSLRRHPHRPVYRD